MAYHWLYSVEFLMRLVLLIMTFLNQTLAAILLNRRICRFESYGARLERLAKLVYAHD